MLASGLKGVVGDTMDATVMLLEAGETTDPTMEFAATGEGVLSATEEYPDDGGVKRC